MVVLLDIQGGSTTSLNLAVVDDPATLATLSTNLGEFQGNDYFSFQASVSERDDVRLDSRRKAKRVFNNF